MGTRITINGAERIYNDGSLWVDRALSGRRLEIDGQALIWSSLAANWEVHKRFLR